MGIQTIQDVQQLFERHGVSQVYVKQLAPKQDNEKNQIYLGSGLDGATNLFPATIVPRIASESVSKPKSSQGRPKVEAQIDLAWFDRKGSLHDALHARIIDYFQYPEIRLSGFMRGCGDPPDALRRRNQSKYGVRILLLGISDAGRILGLVITESEDELVSNFPVLPELPALPSLRVLTFPDKIGTAPSDPPSSTLGNEVAEKHADYFLEAPEQRSLPFSDHANATDPKALAIPSTTSEVANDQKGRSLHVLRPRKLIPPHAIDFSRNTIASPVSLLLDELAAIHHQGWHPSVILKPSEKMAVPFKGSQGGGYTLEAKLGVSANADKAPDKHGYEIKSYSKGKITLMTPTADAGYAGDHSFREFMTKYGRPGKAGDGRIVFTGVHRSHKINNATGAVLIVEGYDFRADTFSSNIEDIRVSITHKDSGEVLCAWTFEKLANSWNKKHASAAYVARDRRPHEGGDGEHDYDYRYLANVFICEGTNTWRLLRAIHSGEVYFDPAHTIYADGEAKVRPQWRINTSRLTECLGHLYKEVELVTLP